MNFLKGLVRKMAEWSIGIYAGRTPLNLFPSASNPVLTLEDITDVRAEFVADPFMVYKQGIWYMFFEVMNARTHRGEIALATSQDLTRWEYEGIVLREPFHLSYPYIFQFQDDYYMVPETGSVGSVRLYKAQDFPDHWVFVRTLLDQWVYNDSSLLYHGDFWWLFTYLDGCLYLYYSRKLNKMRLHPKSPVACGETARPAGRIIVLDGKPVRYSQPGGYYGNHVNALRIDELSTDRYKETVIGEKVLAGSGFGWNAKSMHHVDPHRLGNRWVACVDGCRSTLVLGVPKYLCVRCRL